MVEIACIPNFSFLGELEVTFPGGVGGLRLIIIQLNLTGTATGIELGKRREFGRNLFNLVVLVPLFPDSSKFFEQVIASCETLS